LKLELNLWQKKFEEEKMNKNEKGFSLVVVVIFMSIAALFIGYLMGSWLISFLVEDSSTEMADQDDNPAVVNQQPTQSSQPEVTEEDNNTENNLPTPTEEELRIAPDQSNQNSTEATASQEQNTGTDSADNNVQNTETTGRFGVQIGAFSNYNNALSVRDKVIELGYQVLVTDSSPHQVQVVGYQNRDQAESAAQELEAEGYPGFIVVRE
jgi:cell division septation protein DedD